MVYLEKALNLTRYNFKILLNINVAAAFAYILITPAVLSYRYLSFGDMAKIGENYCALIGIILFVYLGNFENANDLNGITYTRSTKHINIFLPEELTSRSLRVKVKVVNEDEQEKGQRMLLNLGHSFGHALETEAAYHGITHGQGVSIGMVAATYLAEARGLITSAEVQRILNLVKGLELSAGTRGKDPEVLLHLMGADKKNKHGQKVLILPAKIGHALVVRDASDDEILQAWKKVITE
jgi:3-dehydroquinate synthetase